MLVSAVMPTHNRRDLIGMAIDSYLSQTFPEQQRELVILDSGHDGTEEIVPKRSDIRYCRPKMVLNVGRMRNAVADLAQGQIIIHWDSDDWSAPERIERQVERLYVSQKQLTGFHDVFYYDTRTDKTYHYMHYLPPFAAGTSMCYFKSWWKNHPFNEIVVGEDSNFSSVAKGQLQLDSTLTEGLLVARTHGKNSFTPPLGKNFFKPCEPSELPAGFFTALDKERAALCR